MDLRKAAHDPWVWGQVGLFLCIGTAAPFLPRFVNLGDADYLLNRIDPLWIRALAVFPAGYGLYAIGAAARALGPSLTPGIEPLSGAPLAMTGPYALVRHPIYRAAVILLGAWSLAWSNWTLALILTAVARVYLEAKAGAEERWLVERYPAYEAYRRQVPRRLF